MPFQVDPLPSPLAGRGRGWGFRGRRGPTLLEMALGQFMLYERVLRRDQPDRRLWLAVPSRIWAGLFREALGELLLEDGGLRLLVIDVEQEVIERWIPSTPGATPSNES